MANVIIVHGTGGNPEGNWFPWLKSELEKLNCRVFVPRFPTPEDQSLENWLSAFKDYRQYLNGDSIVVGHSLGPSFLLSVLENVKEPIKSAFFVSGFTGLLGNAEYDALNRSFVTRRFDWGRIIKNCKRFYVINSDDDPYVPLEKGRELAENLGTEVIVLKKAGHINKESGYVRFDFLLKQLKKEL